MKIILCGGGTAGHVTPALAIAEELTARYKNCEILFIGREAGDENLLVKNAGYKIKTIPIKGIKRKLTLENIKNAMLAIKAVREARSILEDFKPDAVIGTGGYVCWPVIKAAQQLTIPTAIHESNTVPGLVSRLLAKKCDRVMLNYKDTAQYFKHKDNLCVVGNPLREKFLSLGKSDARRCLNIDKEAIYILSFGGSGGSETLNDTVDKLIKNYSSSNDKITHLHACGKKYFDRYKEDQSYKNCKICAYIDDMPTHLKAADIVICRCGAMTLSEVAASAAAAILIPSPNVTDNHQYKNGKYYADRNAAVLIEESDLSYEKLKCVTESLVRDKKRRTDLSQRIFNLSSTGARRKIVCEIDRIVQNRAK